MAQIPINLFHKWVDTEVVHAADYVLERDSIVTALNDADSKGNTNKTRLDAAEATILAHTNQISLKTDNNGNHAGSWQGKNFFDVESLFSTLAQKYDGAQYLVSPSGFKFQLGVNDDGTLYSQDYTGSYSQWFNPISTDGSKWNILIDDDGSVNTMKV